MKSLCLMMLLVVGLDSMAQAYDIAIPGRERKPPVKRPDAPPKPDVPPKEEPAPIDPKEATPSERKERETLHIRIDPKATEAKLVIPASLLQELQSKGEKSGAYSPLNMIIGESIMARMGTVIGGVLLTLSVLFGGLWLLRHRKLSAYNFGIVIFLLSLSGVGTATLVYANAGPPPEVRSLTGKIFSSAVHTYKQASGDLKIEISKEHDILELIVPDTK